VELDVNLYSLSRGLRFYMNDCTDSVTVHVRDNVRALVLKYCVYMRVRIRLFLYNITLASSATSHCILLRCTRRTIPAPSLFPLSFPILLLPLLLGFFQDFISAAEGKMSEDIFPPLPFLCFLFTFSAV